jgi:3-oxoacyl-[acyl-carrier-protein] synthase-1
LDSGIWIAGIGAISSIGINVNECLHSLESSRSGISTIDHLQTIHKNEFVAGEVKISNEDLARKNSVSTYLSRTALLSLIAAKEALEDSGVNKIYSLRKGLISANTVGGMDKSESFFSEYFLNSRKGRLRDIVNHECGKITEIVAEELNIKNYLSTISTACSSSANSIFHAARLIKNDLIDVAIAGGCDSLTRFTLNGFNSLMILDKEPCRPFDENRNGLNLGEGAAYVVLVSDRVAQMLNKKMYCRLSGYSNANDAFHQTASSPDGTGSFLAMKGALEMSEIIPSQIGYINLHGTGTQNNDTSEATAIQRIFSDSYPKISSTKSFTGHTLGACGGLEAVFSVLSVSLGIAYENLRFKIPMKETNLFPETSFSNGNNFNHVMSNSFGFGGNCTSLIFSKN